MAIIKVFQILANNIAVAVNNNHVVDNSNSVAVESNIVVNCNLVAVKKK